MQARALPEIDGRAIGATVDEMLNRHPVVGLAVGVVRDGRLKFFDGRGVADIASQLPITEDTVFRIASITKTFTAIAVMQLWEQGLVDLEAPVGNYLRSYELIPAEVGHRPATSCHLLTHTAGLGELAHPWGAFLPDFGESVKVGEPVPTLADFYRGALRLHAEPGNRFVYNNHGPSTLGQLVEDVSGMPLDRYFRERIFEPLGMTDSDLLRSEAVAQRLATGYEIRSGGVAEVEDREMVTAGAASIYSTPRDMARYLVALTRGGSNEHGSILSAETLAMMFEPQYRPDPRIPGMGLGFFRIDIGDRIVVGHQGTHPGFHSQILLSPDDGVAVIVVTNGAGKADFWLPAETSRLLRHLIGAPDRVVPTDIPHRPELWDDICGWYRLSARVTDVRLRGMMGAGAEVFVRGGRLMLRFLTPIPALARGFPLHPADRDDPWVFLIDLSESGFDPMRVVFGQDRAGTTKRLCLDVMPLVLDKQPAVTNPRRWTVGVAAVAGAVTARGMLRRRAQNR